MRASFFITSLLLSFCCLTTRAGSQGSSSSPSKRPEGALIQGVTQSALKVPIPQMQVRLRNLSNGDIVTGTSDSAGTFQFVVPEGNYVLSTTLETDTAERKLRVTDRQHIVNLTIPSRKTVHIEQPAISVSQLRIPFEARKALQDGLAASTKNQMKEAIDDTNKAVDLYPQYAMALATRALLERHNNLQQALIDAQRAIELDPNFGLGYVALGSIYTESGKFDDAVRTLNRAIAIQPDAWSGTYEMFRALVKKGDYNAAIIQLQRTCNLVPTNFPFLHLAKADVLIGLKDRASAIRELEAYLKEAPDSPESANATMVLAKLQAVRFQPTESTMRAFQPRSHD